MTIVFSPLFQKYKHGTEGEKTKVEKESERESKTGGGGLSKEKVITAREKERDYRPYSINQSCRATCQSPGSFYWSPRIS